MRLIATDTLELHEFYGSRIPEYAILSHRWGEHEVSFQDLQSRNKQSSKAMMVSRNGVLEEVTIQEPPSQASEAAPGWQKIKGCCKLAADNGHNYVWIDTCCINKESSAELSEAINSMFEWYCRAEICYAYLSDVPNATDIPEASALAFRVSQWFTRSWTLQEMLAPLDVEFYAADWKLIGTDRRLNNVITEVTGVPKPLHRWELASVAQKMSWASKRMCERVEDTAYSLQGLSGVYMPPLYGEGKNAFHRLQLEIIKQSSDESIFAWTLPPGTIDGFDDLLAESPMHFARSGDICKNTYGKSEPDYSITNKGLRIEKTVMDISTHETCKVIALNCSSKNERTGSDCQHMTPQPLVLYPIKSTENMFVRILPIEDIITSADWKHIWAAYEALPRSERKARSIYIKLRS